MDKKNDEKTYNNTQNPQFNSPSTYFNALKVFGFLKVETENIFKTSLLRLM